MTRKKKILKTKFICAKNHVCRTCLDRDQCPEGIRKRLTQQIARTRSYLLERITIDDIEDIIEDVLNDAL